MVGYSPPSKKFNLKIITMLRTRSIKSLPIASAASIKVLRSSSVKLNNFSILDFHSLAEDIHSEESVPGIKAESIIAMIGIFSHY
ncbi:MAG: hypothetical protein A2Y10_17360 [Planctomycetes bacterium GWF2_41_51]|nr:MAG: hypothetical protein A2Y10_17360 [Planctomycetes bacterium GWF2_41_51]HBG27995.1 hypothetical protein [Phycisphaerales bacterium]